MLPLLEDSCDSANVGLRGRGKRKLLQPVLHYDYSTRYDDDATIACATS